MARTIKVLIAEDHDVVREGLKILIRSDPGIQVAGEANNGEAAIRMAGKLQPDVVLMDLAMPRTSGLEAARYIRQKTPRSRVLILSAYQDDDTVQRVLDAGVAGYVTKHSAAAELITAIREVGNGNAYLSPKLAARLSAQRRASFEAGRTPACTVKLSRREGEVVRLIASGQPSKEIAYNLGLSIKTVEKHRQSAMDKLAIHDIAGLTRYAVAKGIVGAVSTPGPMQPSQSRPQAVAQ